MSSKQKVSSDIALAIRRKLKAGLAFDSEHGYTGKLKHVDAGRLTLSAFPAKTNEIFGSDFDKERLAEAFVPVKDFHLSGLGRVNYCNFVEEYFGHVKRVTAVGDYVGWTVAEILRGCKHTHYLHGVCDVGGEDVAFGRDCSDISCPSYLYKQNVLNKDISLLDIASVYACGSVDFKLAFTSWVFTTSPFVRELLTKKFLAGYPVENDLCRLANGVIEELFFNVVGGSSGRTRVRGIIHQSCQNFSSGKMIPVGKTKGRVFLERNFVWHCQGFCLNLAERSDGSIFRLSHIGREFSVSELKEYRVSAGMLWRLALQNYLGVEIPDDSLNSEGTLNIHFNFGASIGMESGGLGNRLLYDNRSAHSLVSSLVANGGLHREMRRLKRDNPAGFEDAKAYLSAILSLPDETGRVLGHRKKSSQWFGLFSGNSKAAFMKRHGIVFKSRKRRIQDIHLLRRIKCPVHPEGEIVIEMKEDKKGKILPVRYSYESLISFFPNVCVILKGGSERVERWKERDFPLDLSVGV